MTGHTLYDKLWLSHIVENREDGTSLLYIDRHLLHEVTSPQAFDGLNLHLRKPWRVDSNIATSDHNIPTMFNERNKGVLGINDDMAKIQVKTIEDNCQKFNIKIFSINDINQGIVHIIGPEQGLTLPGMTIVCGDSHTSTHGAFSALSHGIGTSEVEHVLATQCLLQKKMKNMLIRIDGTINQWVTPKDIILAIIGIIGNSGCVGYAIEFTGNTIRKISMEGRMTICNMAIEAGAIVGLVAVDEKNIDYLYNRPFTPIGKIWHKAVKTWKKLFSDNDAHFDKIININVDNIEPQVTWGTSPEMVTSIKGTVPNPNDIENIEKRINIERALEYMGLDSGQKITDIIIDRVFIGSCTNARIEDLREAANIAKGKYIASKLKQAIVVPGSGLVKLQAEKEGLDKIFIDAGFEWREPGCSMCLAMNADKLGKEEHCASTSNRNFEGRQGYRGRTHLVSPAMASAAAINGYFIDISNYI
ncbi:3-isopropylmalate dehydratase large subunit [Candidatus Johnevansia muelleri]|uniref:3-isopropylmalate dehydratase large subunit n=1 Tax=Candidatus Johnevansia muelleri TaxID=1495769 RepID=A0A078KBB3_9GAMM|nr:3-isopropylmalate dehydratase large subunit [Candidatus Evansia muelleri]